MDDSTTHDNGASGFSYEGVPDAAASDEFDWDDLTPEPGAVPVPAKKARKKLTPQRAKGYTERKKSGFWFLLQHTRDEDGEPMEALVHRINFLDRETLIHLPKAVQTRLININVERMRKRGEVTRDSLTPQMFVREMGRSREMADAYVCAGFVDPKVYPTKEEAELMGGVWVEDIDVADRMIFSAVCEGSWEDALTVLTPFSDRPDVDAEPGETVGPVPGEAPEPDDPFGDEAPLPPIVLVEQRD